MPAEASCIRSSLASHLSKRPLASCPLVASAGSAISCATVMAYQTTARSNSYSITERHVVARSARHSNISTHKSHSTCFIACASASGLNSPVYKQHHDGLPTTATNRRGQCERRVACRVLTESAKMELGSQASEFELPEPLTGKTVSLTAAAAGAQATLVMFICNHCPFVVMLKAAISALAKEYQAKGVTVIAISSNSAQTHPQDGPQRMAQDANRHGYTFPYLYDESQSVAKAYKAACTPEFYVFDKDLRLTYHGQFDDARPNNGKPVTGADLRVALDATVAGKVLPAGFQPRPSIGCSIKWHPGQEPDYSGTQAV